MFLQTPKAIIDQYLRPIALPDDLEDVASIDANECSPEEAGLSSRNIDAIWQDMQKLYCSGMHPLLSVCIRRHGKIAFNRSLGYQWGDAHSEDASIADINTPICLFSASKGISAMLAHLLAEQGRINLLDPLSHYIPAFAENGKGYITIYQLLAHRAGVPGLGNNIEDVLFDREAALNQICKAKPIDRLGRTSAYHAITGGFLLDELIRVTTGLTVQQYMDRYIRKPMGMRFFRFGLTKRDLPKVAENRVTGLPLGPLLGPAVKNILGQEYERVIELSNGKQFQQAVLAAGNIYSTAEEASRFYQMLLDYGHYEDQQIIQPLTVHRATQEVGKTVIDSSLRMPVRFSPGFMLGGNPIGIYGRDSHYAFGHLGLSNVVCWADPQRDISVAILNTGKPVIGKHLLSFGKLLQSIPKHCSKVRDLRNGIPEQLML